MRVVLRRLGVSILLGGLAIGALSPIIAAAADPAGSLTPTRRASSMDPLPATRVMPPKPPLPDSPPLRMAEPMSAVPAVGAAGAPSERVWFRSPDWSDAVWTGLAAAALAVALAIGVWALRRAGVGATAPEERPTPTRSAAAPRKRATAQAGIAERFEQERAKAALRRVLADSAAETPEPEDDVAAAPAGEDPNRILLLTSPEARRRAALDRARRNAALARPPRPLGFSYAASRRRQHLVEAGAKPPRSVVRPAASETDSPPDVSGESGVPDKSARISSVIRGMKAFDARTKAQQPGRHPRQDR